MLEVGWVEEMGLLKPVVGLEVGTVRRWLGAGLVQSSTGAGWEVGLAPSAVAMD